VQRLLHPVPLDKPGMGLLFSIAASVINLVVGLILIKNGKKRHSLALESDGHHLMTDVYTTGGVLIGLVIVYATRLYILDPIIAIIVGLNIISAGFSIVQKSLSGFMDSSIGKEYLDFVKNIFAEYKSQKIEFHGMRTRQSGSRKFITFHMLVPGAWSVQQAHSLSEEVEKKIRSSIPQVTITIHIEPLEDPVSWEDTELDRK
jgi:cation diffusion facilitator family transporter